MCPVFILGKFCCKIEIKIWMICKAKPSSKGKKTLYKYILQGNYLFFLTYVALMKNFLVQNVIDCFHFLFRICNLNIIKYEVTQLNERVYLYREVIVLKNLVNFCNERSHQIHELINTIIVNFIPFPVNDIESGSDPNPH